MKALRTLTSVVFAMMAFAANAQEGTWNGELNVMGNKVPLVFNFSTNGCTIDSPSQGVNGIQAEKTVKDDGSFNAETIEIEWNKSGESKDPAVYPPYIRLNAAYCSESLRSYVTGGYSRINNSEVYEKEYTTTEKITMVNYLILNSDDSDTVSCFVQISFRKDVLSSEAIKDQLFDLATEVEQKLSDIAKQKH